MNRRVAPGSISVSVRVALLASFVAVLALASCGDGGVSPGMVDPIVRLSGTACSVPSAGVGIIVDTNTVLTSGHAMDALDPVQVRLADGREAEGEVVHIDRVLDLAVVAIDPSTSPDGIDFSAVDGDARFGDAGTDDRGVIALLTDEGERVDVPYVVERRIRASTLDVGRNNEISRRSLQLAASIERGDSGAPLINDAGEIVGVVWATSVRQEARAYAVRGDEIEAVLEDAKVAASGPGSC